MGGGENDVRSEAESDGSPNFRRSKETRYAEKIHGTTPRDGLLQSKIFLRCPPTTTRSRNYAATTLLPRSHYLHNTSKHQHERYHLKKETQLFKQELFVCYTKPY